MHDRMNIERYEAAKAAYVRAATPRGGWVEKAADLFNRIGLAFKGYPGQMTGEQRALRAEFMALSDIVRAVSAMNPIFYRNDRDLTAYCVLCGGEDEGDRDPVTLLYLGVRHQPGCAWRAAREFTAVR